MLLSTLHLLTDGEDIDLALRYFELRFLSLLGYQPQLTQCVHCGGPIEGRALRFSGQLGGVLCPDCWGQDGRAVSLCQGTLEMLKRFLTMTPRTLRVLGAAPAVRRELERVLRICLEYRLPRELKSRRFLALVQGEGF